MSDAAAAIEQAKRLLDRFRLDGRVALVTGGGRGIGRATAAALAAAGAKVAVCDMDGAAAAAAAAIAEAGYAAEAHVMDVTDEAQVVTVVEAVAEGNGRLDVLINNAGTSLRQPAEELSLENWNKVVAVNMTGVFLCAREAGKRMLAQGSGNIVNLASKWGMVAGPFYGNLSYHATKGAVVMMTRALASEWGPRIRVNAIGPTFVRTPLTAHLFNDPQIREGVEQFMPLNRMAETDDMIGGILYLASDASSMVTGEILMIDGGWTAR